MKLKLTDYLIIVGVIILLAIGTFAVLKKKNFSNLPIEKEVQVYFDVFFRGVTISGNTVPFNTNDDAFITIRNVPYTKLKIVGVQGRPRMKVITSNNTEGFLIVEDASTPNLYDFIVRLEDKAKKTPDGLVVGGNKLKMGIPVVIEGSTYKYSGTISNIIEVDEQLTPPEQTDKSLIEKEIEKEIYSAPEEPFVNETQPSQEQEALQNETQTENKDATGTATKSTAVEDKPTTQPAATQSTKPAATQTTQPAATQSTKPTATQTTKPTATQTTKPAAKTAPKPNTAPAAKTTK